METYQHDFARLRQAFVQFLQNLPFYGAAVLCADDVHVREILPFVSKPVLTYGTGPDATVRAENIAHDAGRMRFRARRGSAAFEVTLNLPGHHNVLNALAAIAVGLELRVPFAAIAMALAEFRGAERRFERKGEARGVTVVDDYGHHPTEIAAVMRAARAGHPKRVVAVFQPHRYSRTRDLLADFGPALGLADIVVLTDIYPAGEAPLPGITVDALADVVRAHADEVRVVPKLDELPAAVAAIVRDGDLVFTLGAGSIGGVGDRILAALSAQEGQR